MPVLSNIYGPSLSQFDCSNSHFDSLKTKIFFFNRNWRDRSFSTGLHPITSTGGNNFKQNLNIYGNQRCSRCPQITTSFLFIFLDRNIANDLDLQISLYVKSLPLDICLESSKATIFQNIIKICFNFFLRRLKIK